MHMYIYIYIHIYKYINFSQYTVKLRNILHKGTALTLPPPYPTCRIFFNGQFYFFIGFIKKMSVVVGWGHNDVFSYPDPVYIIG